LLFRSSGLVWRREQLRGTEVEHQSYFYPGYEGGGSLEQVAQRSCGCPLHESVQDEVGWSSEQPGLVEDVPAYGRGVGTR